ncbi:hypothetical protein ZWY2020_051285, partial [Hordeum vulgare]
MDASECAFPLRRISRRLCFQPVFDRLHESIPGTRTCGRGARRLAAVPPTPPPGDAVQAAETPALPAFQAPPQQAPDSLTWDQAITATAAAIGGQSTLLHSACSPPPWIRLCFCAPLLLSSSAAVFLHWICPSSAAPRGSGDDKQAVLCCSSYYSLPKLLPFFLGLISPAFLVRGDVMKALAIGYYSWYRSQGSSSSDKVGSCTENNSSEASETELQNFDSGEIEEEDYDMDDEDEGCYDDDNEGSDYEFDESDFNQQLADKFDDLDLPPGVEATVPWLQKAATDDGPSNFKSMSEIEDDIGKKYKFLNSLTLLRISLIIMLINLLERLCTIILEDLTIQTCMLVKVCLSLLGTWEGHGCEKWNSAHSTMLQVLISIQALVLNEKPYFNEPGYETYANNASGQRTALEYNDTTFQYSCRTMLYSLRRAPQ